MLKTDDLQLAEADGGAGAAVVQQDGRNLQKQLVLLKLKMNVVFPSSCVSRCSEGFLLLLDTC